MKSFLKYLAPILLAFIPAFVVAQPIPLAGSVEVFDTNPSTTTTTAVNLDVSSNAVVGGSMTASAFFGDGSNLTGISGVGWTDNAGEIVLTDPADFVGIGTSSPAVKLHISSGGLTIDGNVNPNIRLGNNSKISFLNNAGDQTSAEIQSQTNDSLTIETQAGTVRMQFFDGGEVVLTSTAPLTVLSTATFQDLKAQAGSFSQIHSSGTTTLVGNVGIGTASPGDKLDIEDGNLRLTSTGGTEIFIQKVGGTGDLSLNTNSGTALNLKINGTAKLTVDVNGIGIGTASPDSTLHVSDGGIVPTTGGELIVSDTSDPADGVSVSLIGGANGTNVINFGDTDDSAYAQIKVNSPAQSMAFHTGNLLSASTPAMFINNAQNVGIGTAVPCSTCALQVEGGVTIHGNVNMEDTLVMHDANVGHTLTTQYVSGNVTRINSSNANMIWGNNGANQLNLAGSTLQPWVNGGLNLGSASNKWASAFFGGSVKFGLATSSITCLGAGCVYWDSDVGDIAQVHTSNNVFNLSAMNGLDLHLTDDGGLGLIVQEGGNVSVGGVIPCSTCTLHVVGNISASGSFESQGRIESKSSITASGFFGDGSGLTGIVSAGGWDVGSNIISPTALTDAVSIGTNTTEAVLGLTINQGPNDDAILVFQSDDVSHGSPSAKPETFGSFNKGNAITGGLRISGFTDSDNVGMFFESRNNVATASDENSPSFRFQGLIGVGGGTNLDDADTVLAVSNGSKRVFVVKGDGRVGIGTNGQDFNLAFTPCSTCTLHVSGDGAITGSLEVAGTITGPASGITGFVVIGSSEIGSGFSEFILDSLSFLGVSTLTVTNRGGRPLVGNTSVSVTNSAGANRTYKLRVVENGVVVSATFTRVINSGRTGNVSIPFFVSSSASGSTEYVIQINTDNISGAQTVDSSAIITTEY